MSFNVSGVVGVVVVDDVIELSNEIVSFGKFVPATDRNNGNHSSRLLKNDIMASSSSIITSFLYDGGTVPYVFSTGIPLLSLLLEPGSLCANLTGHRHCLLRWICGVLYGRIEGLAVNAVAANISGCRKADHDLDKRKLRVTMTTSIRHRCSMIVMNDFTTYDGLLVPTIDNILDV